MACIDVINTNSVFFTSYGLDKNMTCTGTARASEIHLYKTCINVNGRHWNTCKLVFTGTHILALMST